MTLQVQTWDDWTEVARPGLSRPMQVLFNPGLFADVAADYLLYAGASVAEGRVTCEKMREILWAAQRAREAGQSDLSLCCELMDLLLSNLQRSTEVAP